MLLWGPKWDRNGQLRVFCVIICCFHLLQKELLPADIDHPESRGRGGDIEELPGALPEFPWPMIWRMDSDSMRVILDSCRACVSFCMRSIEGVHGNHSPSPQRLQRLQRSQRPHWNPFRFHGQIAWEPHFSYPQPSIGWCQGLSSTVYGSWNVSKIRIKREDESMEHYDGGRFRFFGEGFPIDPFWVHEKHQTGPTKVSFCS